ncbi:MAG: DUF928 domain-containing protein [Cyanobacteria bacterium P01_D01_bin.105]
MKTKTAFSNFAVLSILLSGWNSLSISAASAVEDLSRMKEASARVSFVPRSDSPAPRRTQSGASRRELPGVCDGLPVLPENGFGLTADNDPSLFVYFAEGTTVEKARLTLKSLDEEESEYYETIVTLPQEKLSESGGVLAFEMPEIDTELAMDQEYAWSLILMCEGQLRPDSPVLSGFLQRVEATSVDVQEGEASLIEQATAYGAAGIWYDLLSTLALMRSEGANGEVFNESWSSVMSEAGLDVISSAPLIVE